MCSAYQHKLPGVLQGSILGTNLFTIFINDLPFFIKEIIHNFADESTLSVKDKTNEAITNKLENESNIALRWLATNDMIASPEKFQVMLHSKSKKKNSGR